MALTLPQEEKFIDFIILRIKNSLAYLLPHLKPAEYKIIPSSFTKVATYFTEVIKLWELRQMQSLEYLRCGILAYLPIMVFQVLEKIIELYYDYPTLLVLVDFKDFLDPPQLRGKWFWSLVLFLSL